MQYICIHSHQLRFLRFMKLRQVSLMKYIFRCAVILGLRYELGNLVVIVSKTKGVCRIGLLLGSCLCCTWSQEGTLLRKCC